MSGVTNSSKISDPSAEGRNKWQEGWVTIMPGVFVLLWSTGFIGGKLGLPYAGPFTFLLVRFVLVVMLLLPFVLLLRVPWPRSPIAVLHIALVGIMVHAIYLGGVFAAIGKGMPAGLASLIVGLQPVLTAALAGPVLGERIRPLQWGGISLGLVGVAMVLGEKIVPSGGSSLFDGFPIEALFYALAALGGITIGTMYQKRFCATGDLRSGAVIQFIAAGLAMSCIALPFEDNHIEWHGEFIFALAWLVLVLSVGAITLLMLLIRRGAASKVASLFYLVPPVTAVMAWILFGETPGLLALAGMLVAMGGVALVVRK